MHPAFSVIVFTTLSGAGYGLWFWLGLRIAFGPPARGFEPLLWLIMLALGAALVGIGLLASLWHLGKPARAWRAFSQWRTSWLSREGVLAVLCFVPALFLLVLLPAPTSAEPTLALRFAAGALSLVSLATVACTAMIYASLKPIPAWQHPLVLPIYLGFALFTGGLLHQALGGALGGGATGIGMLLFPLALVVLKLAYWQAVDHDPLPVTRADAVGLRGREIEVFERPHTEPNYLTREMGFVLARKHARKLRAIALLLFGVLPMLGVALAILVPAIAGPALAIAALSALVGALVERWLFFAQARHVVMLYY